MIAVFTKFDQFLRNVKIDLEDFGNPDDDVADVVEKLFEEHYLGPLGDDVRYVRLESEFPVICQGQMVMFFGRNAHER